MIGLAVLLGSAVNYFVSDHQLLLAMEGLSLNTTAIIIAVLCAIILWQNQGLIKAWLRVLWRWKQ